ncbi:MAG: DNA repair protein RadC [Gammaproteobacteria bacterium]|nr:DNA repair protein RadC [Gammaproteobacteria bacterium]
MAITKWPADERPREKLARSGAQALSDAELLAIFLRTGVKGKSAVDLGRDLLGHYGGLRQVLNAGQGALGQISGLGPAKCAQLQAALELGKRYLEQKLEREGPLTSPKQAAEFLTHQLRDRPREVFAIVYLDNRHHVLDYEELFYGTLNGAHVHPREVVKNALARNAAAVIVAHNHPSGIAEPSQADTTITIKLRDALSLVEVRLLDHLVIGDGEFVSMSDRGLF